jgi:heterodisulfide reductase subunit A
VVGSGPAGLTVAYYLRLKGYQVTLFEALPVNSAACCVWASPTTACPRTFWTGEIDYLLRHGIDARTGKCAWARISI